MTARALRQVQADLIAMIADENITVDGIQLAAVRIGAQAEMLELGLGDE